MKKQKSKMKVGKTAVVIFVMLAIAFSSLALAGGDIIKAGIIVLNGTGVQIAGGNLDLSSSKIINVATPTASGDAATKGYVDNQVTGGFTTLSEYTSATTFGYIWVAQTQDTAVRQFAISAADNNTIFFAADISNAAGNVTVFRSNTGGANWSSMTLQPSGGATWPSINALNSTNVYVSYYNSSGSTLMFYKSIDGGVTWTPAKAYIGLPIYGTKIVAYNSSNIYIAYFAYNASSGMPWSYFLARSTDGGTTWNSSKTIDSGSTSYPGLSLSVLDANNIFIGYVGGGATAAKIAKTTDGGTTWTNATAASYSVYTSMKAINTTNIYFVNHGPSHNVEFRKSTDGGTTWAAINITAGPASASEPAIDVINSTNIYVMYGMGATYLAKSTDGGASFTIKAIKSSGAYGAEYGVNAISVTPSGNIFTAFADSQYTPVGIIFAKTPITFLRQNQFVLISTPFYVTDFYAQISSSFPVTCESSCPSSCTTGTGWGSNTCTYDGNDCASTATCTSNLYAAVYAVGDMSKIS